MYARRYRPEFIPPPNGITSAASPQASQAASGDGAERTAGGQADDRVREGGRAGCCA